ncbi:polysaccharide pyruvyl transferase family protein [Bacteroides sp. ET225]|uniref:polysaccharide pyruvyl transferase family protein n=1 Tax=Bacteroides sp. ET225 TaxID=2972461 RepID=UPI0021AC4A10|nr:polysaccharide pyruvyl transferase family protein [Bacteroides sp. ET225]MCR8916919.1 polysaccharide pyruvyl transferase family protein [Bacteroides sp. ET225]
MKIGILTFHCAINYGAVLQAFGLQEYLKEMGHEVYIIDYCPEYLKASYNIFDWKWSHDFSFITNVYFLIRKIMTIPLRIKRKYSFIRFSNRFLNLYPYELCCNKSNDFDAFIIGSDQVWNPKITNGFDKIYFGKFPASQGKKIISYAASVGSVLNLEASFDKFQKLLTSFTSISVREKSLAELIIKNYKLPVSITVDPVLLLGQSAFTAISSTEKKKKKPYVLVFQLYYTESAILDNVIKKVVSKKKLAVLKLSASSESLFDKNLLSAESPQNFLDLFRNASYIITSSFHGTIFAILFQKDFNTIGFNKIQSERMNDFLSSLGLEHRLISNNSQIATDTINFSDVNKRLEKLRTLSDNFLTTALS